MTNDQLLNHVWVCGVIAGVFVGAALAYIFLKLTGQL